MARKGEGIEGDLPIVLPALHPGQEAVLRDARRINWLCAGRGWRKSSLAVRLVLDYIFRRKFVLYTAFTMEPIDILIEELWKSRIIGEELWKKCFHETKKMLFLPGLTPIRFASLEEAANQRGATPHRVILDEAGKAKRGDFDRVIGPMLFKSGGDFWGFGTPDPDDPLNDFYEHLTNEKAPEYVARFIIPVVGAVVTPEGKLIRQPHPYENPHKSFEELRISFESTPPSKIVDWEIEYLCAFKLGGSVQIENPERVCVYDYVESKDVDGECIRSNWRHTSGNQYKCGVDLAISDNFTVLSVMTKDPPEMVYFRRFQPKSNTEKGRWKQVYESIARVRDLFHGVEFDIDVTGEGSHVLETLADAPYYVFARGFNFSGSSVKKNDVMNNLTNFVEGQHVLLFNHPDLRQEMKDLRRIKREGQGPQIKAAGGGLDDCPVSVALMLYGLPLTTSAVREEETRKLRELVEQAVSKATTPSAGSVANIITPGSLWKESLPEVWLN